MIDPGFAKQKVPIHLTYRCFDSLVINRTGFPLKLENGNAFSSQGKVRKFEWTGKVRKFQANIIYYFSDI